MLQEINGVRFYDIPANLDDYHGYGRAWAAIRDGEIVGLRYMKPPYPAAIHNELLHDELLEYISPTNDDAAMYPAHVFFNAKKRENRQRGIDAISRLAKQSGMCKSAAAFHQAMQDERSKHADNRRAGFAAYRAACRADMEAMGEVVSGFVSGRRFTTR